MRICKTCSLMVEDGKVDIPDCIISEGHDWIKPKLTKIQESHLISIQVAFAVACNEKYRRGAAEHGGNLFELTPAQLLDDAIAECIDQFTYLVTLRDKLVS